MNHEEHKGHEDKQKRDRSYSVYASGGPAGGQTFEKFDKQVLKSVIERIRFQRQM